MTTKSDSSSSSQTVDSSSSSDEEQATTIVDSLCAVLKEDTGTNKPKPPSLERAPCPRSTIQPGAVAIFFGGGDNHHSESYHHDEEEVDDDDYHAPVTAAITASNPTLEMEQPYLATAKVVDDDLEQELLKLRSIKTCEASAVVVKDNKDFDIGRNQRRRARAWLCCACLVLVAIAIAVSMALVQSKRKVFTTSASPDAQYNNMDWIKGSALERFVQSLDSNNHTLKMIGNETTSSVNLSSPDWYLNSIWMDLSFQPTSAQAQAYKWLVSSPEAILSWTESEINTRFVLAVLYFDTNGAAWTRKDNWLDRNLHVCEWYSSADESSDSNMTSSYKNDCWEHGFHQLVLINNGLVGTISCEVTMLTQLIELTLTENSALGGRITRAISNMTQLETLNLTGNALTGRVPTEIGNFTKLTSLSLADNYFDGPLPLTLANLSLLTDFSIGANGVDDADSVWLDSVYRGWPRLTSLEIAANGVERLEFHSFSSAMEQWSSLDTLSMKNVKLSGSIPTVIGSLTNLTTLVLSGCDLNRTIPQALQELTGLQYLDISSNLLDGTVPNELFQALRTIQSLDIGNNALSGTLSTSVGLLTQVRTLSLAGNDLSGTIPTELGLVSNAASIFLEDNR